MKNLDIYNENAMKAETILHDKKQEILATESNDIAKEANEISNTVKKQSTIGLVVSVLSVLTAIVTAVIAYLK